MYIFMKVHASQQSMSTLTEWDVCMSTVWLAFISHVSYCMALYADCMTLHLVFISHVSYCPIHKHNNRSLLLAAASFSSISIFTVPLPLWQCIMITWSSPWSLGFCTDCSTICSIVEYVCPVWHLGLIKNLTLNKLKHCTHPLHMLRLQVNQSCRTSRLPLWFDHTNIVREIKNLTISTQLLLTNHQRP